MKFFKRNIYDKIIKRGDLVFDVGSNIGDRIQLFLDQGARVVGVEPQSACFEQLAKRYSGNPRVNVLKLAVSDKASKAKIYLADANTISSMSREFIEKTSQQRFKAYNWDGEEDVNTVTLDSLIRDYGVPEFIKIDIEGYESVALQGLTQAIKYMSIEYTPELHEKTEEAIRIIENISSGYVFNFSRGESLILNSKKWLGPDQIIAYLSEKYKDSRTEFGDVYAMHRH